MRSMKVTLILLSVVAFSRPALADMIWHDAYKSPFSSWGAYMYDQNVKRHLRERTTRTTSSAAAMTSTSSAAPALPRAPITATDFSRNPSGKDVIADFVAKTGLSAADGAKLAEGLRATMTQLGSAGRKDNIANAMTLLVGLCYGVIEKPGFDLTKADDLIPTINDALAASPQFKSLGASDRQNMYDSMLLSTAVIALVHQSDKQASKTIAKQALQQLGLPSE